MDVLSADFIVFYVFVSENTNKNTNVSRYGCAAYIDTLGHHSSAEIKGRLSWRRSASRVLN